MKGKEKRKGKEKETCSRASTNNLRLILTRTISFWVPAADDPYVFQPLKRISSVDLLSCLLYNKTWLQETGRHLCPVGGGGGGGWTIQMATMVINGTTNMKIAAQKAALQNLRSWINNKTGQEIALGQVFKGRKFPKRKMKFFYSFYFIMQGKLVILRTRCFVDQNTSQLQWFKEKKLLQSKFCRKLKSSI